MEMLDYRIEERDPGGVRFEEDEAGCSLTFRMTPAWVAWLPVGIPLATGLMYVIGLVFMFNVLAQMPIPMRMSWGLWAMFGGLILFFLGTAMASWRALRRYGNLPRTWI